MAYKFQIGTFVTSGSIDVSAGDIDLNDGAVENADLAGNITSDKMASFEAGQVAFSGDADAFVSSETAKHNLDLETAARLAGDTNLQNSLNAEIADRIAGDATLQTNLTAEVNRATAAEAAIQADVDQNEADSDAAHSAATTDRAAIRSEFAAADSTLQSNIDTEKARIDAMLSGSSVDLDTLIEIVDAYELADTNIISTITSLQNDVDQNELDGDNDRALIRTEFAAADAALSGTLNTEVNFLIADIAAVQADVDQNEADADAAILAEETARIAGDAALSTSITNLSSAVASDFASQQSDFDADIAALQAEIDAEEVRAQAAEAALQTNIDSEEAARIAADTTLQNNINSLSGTLNTEVNFLIADIASVQADVDQNELDGDNDRALIRTEFAAADLAEANLRVSGDAALQTEINNLSGAVSGDLAALQADVDQNEADADAAILAEETARIAADGVATTDRAAIRTEFAAADTILQNNIDVEKARIDAMLSGSSVDLDTLIEIVDAYELADTSIISSITTLQADVDQNEADGDADRALIRTEFAAADSALSSSIMSSLSFEVNALLADIGAVQADVDQNEADGDADRALIRTEFAAADSALSSSIMASLSFEVNALISDIGMVQADVDQNEADGDADRALIRTEFAAADTTLQNNINALSSSFAGDLAAAEQKHDDEYALLFATKSMSASGNADKTVVFIDGGMSNVSVAVPAGVQNGEYKRIKRTDASANSVVLTGAIEGVASNSVSLFDNAAVMLVWDGTYWWIM